MRIGLLLLALSVIGSTAMADTERADVVKFDCGTYGAVVTLTPAKTEKGSTLARFDRAVVCNTVAGPSLYILNLEDQFHYEGAFATEEDALHFMSEMWDAMTRLPILKPSAEIN
jgi:hypothetical protein